MLRVLPPPYHATRDDPTRRNFPNVDSGDPPGIRWLGEWVESLHSNDSHAGIVGRRNGLGCHSNRRWPSLECLHWRFSHDRSGTQARLWHHDGRGRSQVWDRPEHGVGAVGRQSDLGASGNGCTSVVFGTIAKTTGCGSGSTPFRTMAGRGFCRRRDLRHPGLSRRVISTEV